MASVNNPEILDLDHPAGMVPVVPGNTDADVTGPAGQEPEVVRQMRASGFEFGEVDETRAKPTNRNHI